MSKKLWGGRFEKGIDQDFDLFQKSIHYDYKLAEYDVVHSLIHIAALKEAGILDAQESLKLSKALKEIQSQIKSGDFEPDLSCEDIHSDIQNRVEKKAGALALKLHTLRSRNDQVVFDERFYCFENALDIFEGLIGLEKSLLLAVAKEPKEYFVGYTHTKRAQAIYFSDYLLAYVNMFGRDFERMKNFCDALSIFIGAGALTGSCLAKEDYKKAIKVFGGKKIKVTEKPLDNVSDRDFVIEFLSILSIVQMHLSRMAEDLILYSTKEFDFIDLPEEFCTGSSLMPHKKNPDFLELVRGNTGRVYGNLMSVLTTMKGLPLSYNRDMQLDKEPLFSSVEVVENELKLMAKFIGGIKLKKDSIACALKDKTLYATELAEWLVTEKEVAFKNAHDAVGKLVKLAEKKNEDFQDLSDTELRAIHPALNKSVIGKIMNPKYAVESKKTFSRKLPKK
ncbi:MAG: argininosuccinate lyase [Candidatus Omnitrophota bacterium]